MVHGHDYQSAPVDLSSDCHTNVIADDREFDSSSVSMSPRLTGIYIDKPLAINQMSIRYESDLAGQQAKQMIECH